MDILIDFDGTCVTHEFPLVGKDIGAAQVLRDLVRNGHRLILFTMQAEDCSIQPAIDWFAENGIALYAVQRHPEQHKFTSSPKALGDLMIDDTALGGEIVFVPIEPRLRGLAMGGGRIAAVGLAYGRAGGAV